MRGTVLWEQIRNVTPELEQVYLSAEYITEYNFRLSLMKLDKV